jgi:hypothetical protein
MAARPFIARAQTELGFVGGDAAMVEAGLDELERLGDVEQAARVAADRKSGLVPAASA